MSQHTKESERLSGNDHLLPIANFTDSPQAAALAAKFGDRDLAKLSQVDQAALVLILARLAYRDLIGRPETIWQAAEQAIAPEEDETTDDIETALEILGGIEPFHAIELIQFLVQ